MKVYIASDHGGFALKTQLLAYLKDKNSMYEDLGPYELNPVDDYPDYAKKVCRKIAEDMQNSVGILLCRNGVGMSIVANRFKGIRCVLGFNELQVQKAKEDDNVNVLSLPSDYITIEQAQKFTDIFLSSQFKTEEKYSRRLQKIDE
jgi:ribose 5-phosphate isomerase B